MTETTGVHHVSDTAYWMASYRAQESKRKDALFHDPLAEALVGEKGKRISASMKSVARYAYWALVVRTRVIDAYLTDFLNQGCRTVINLGAGLDTRPYRLDLPKDVQWIEIDFASVIQMKTGILEKMKPKCHLERVSLDFSDREGRRRVFADLDARIGPAIVLMEGVIPYLTEEMVADLADDLRALSNVKFWIGDYYSPDIYSIFQSPKFQKSLGESPFRFFPQDWFPFFEKHGWARTDLRYLFDEGERLNRRFPLPFWAHPLKLFVGRERFRNRLRLQGYMVLEKA